MELLWSDGGGDNKSIHEALSRTRQIDRSNVHSTLRRLLAKGFVEREKLGGVWCYRARISRDGFKSLVKRMSFD